MKFYDIEGNGLEKDEFIEYYTKLYYLSEESPKVKRLNRVSRFVENEMDKILKNGINSELDLFKVIAWKIGAISHIKSEKEQKFIYNYGNRESGNIVYNYHKRVIYVNDIYSFLHNNNDDIICKLGSNIWQDIYTMLIGQKWKNVGPVYCFTLLYFISGGKFPIYDKYAAMALTAINGDMKIGSSIKYTGLDNNEKAIKKYDNFIQDLEKNFGKEYETNRDIDRALWVYGHLLKQQLRLSASESQHKKSLR